MENTQFKNATGWPAEGHYTTAKDLALLAKAIINDHPEHYKIYSEKSFKYNGIAQDNRNKLLFLDDAVDGLKTGHTNEAGFCLVASGVKNNMRLISVVMGTRSEKSRAIESQKLMAYGFRYFETYQLFETGEVIADQRVWKGKVEKINIGIADGISLTIPRRSQERLATTTTFESVIQAPLTKGQKLGSIKVELDGKLMLELPLVALEVVEEAGFFSRLWDSIKLFFFELFV
jgi:D-alanyl-D-alanine carboxypeptidase (penicillin-binding protein 5/6)